MGGPLRPFKPRPAQGGPASRGVFWSHCSHGPATTDSITSFPCYSASSTLLVLCFDLASHCSVTVRKTIATVKALPAAARLHGRPDSQSTFQSPQCLGRGGAKLAQGVVVSAPLSYLIHFGGPGTPKPHNLRREVISRNPRLRYYHLLGRDPPPKKGT